MISKLVRNFKVELSLAWLQHVHLSRHLGVGPGYQKPWLRIGQLEMSLTLRWAAIWAPVRAIGKSWLPAGRSRPSGRPQMISRKPQHKRLELCWSLPTSGHLFWLTRGFRTTEIGARIAVTAQRFRNDHLGLFWDWFRNGHLDGRLSL